MSNVYSEIIIFFFIFIEISKCFFLILILFRIFERLDNVDWGVGEGL